ncbi:GlxA family transcriptional regulator [Streptomyces nigra]
MPGYPPADCWAGLAGALWGASWRPAVGGVSGKRADARGGGGASGGGWGARVLSVCSGVFMLGAAGLLDGRRCSVHWRHAEELARRHPRTTVEPDVLYVDEGPVITSAGTAAGIDACLHLVRKEQGPEVANKIARRMVVPPHRDGGQAQYIERPLPASSCDTVGEVLAWMERHLDEDVTVEQLAERALMSPRTFARRFQQETGTTPYRWILRQRVLLAQQLLEATDETVDAIAGRTGFSRRKESSTARAARVRTTAVSVSCSGQKCEAGWKSR